MRTSLKVDFLATVDVRSGTYFRYHNLARGLIARGHQVTVFSQDLGNRRCWAEERRDGVDYVLAPSFPGDSYVPTGLNPGNILRRFFGPPGRGSLRQADVMHLFQPFENASYPWWLKMRKNRQSVREKMLFAWDWDDLWCGGFLTREKMARPIDRLHYRLVEMLEHGLPRHADLVTTCSGFLADLARDRGAQNVEVIHNGFWAHAPNTVSVSRKEVRQNYGLGPNALYLAFTGFTWGEFDWCLDLLGHFVEDPKIRLVCCGADMKETIARRSKAIGAKVDSLGVLSSAETKRVLSALDIGLLPLDDTLFNRSRLPMKFAEYLAADLPVLCSDVGEVGHLARLLSGVVLLPAERGGWAEGARTAVGRLRADSSAARPDPGQLQKLLSWPTMAAQLEGTYLRHLKTVRGELSDGKVKVLS